MSAREELLRHLWKEVININLRDASLDNTLGTAGAIRRVPSETRGRPSSGYWQRAHRGGKWPSSCGAPPTRQPSERSTR
jgi:hypothetical protein